MAIKPVLDVLDGGIVADLNEMRFEYERALRLKESLEKNYARRKKLNLLDEDSEFDLKRDIKDATYEVEDLKKKLRAAESQSARSRVIADTNERSPWE